MHFRHSFERNFHFEAPFETSSGSTPNKISSNLRDSTADLFELNPLPPVPSIYTSELIKKIEDQLGKNIEEIPSGDRSNFTIQVGEIAYSDRVQNLFYRIANNFIRGSTASSGRQYLSLRKKGISHEQAILQIKEEESIPLPVSFETFTPAVVQSIQAAIGTPISDLSSNDRTAFCVVINGREYSDVAQNLFYRLASRLGTSSVSVAKKYLALRGAGLEHNQAIKLVLTDYKPQAGIQRKSRRDSLPVKGDFFHPEVIQKIEKSLNKNLNQISVNDDTLFSIEIDGNTYSDKPANLFERISITFFHKKNKVKGRAYLVLIGSGLSHNEAVDNVDSEKPLRKKSTGIDPKLLSAEVISKIEQELDKSIESISVGDRTEFTISINSVQYTDTACNLFHRIANRILDVSSVTSGREYLMLLKQGIPSSQARKIALGSASGKEKKQRNKNPLPVQHEFINPNFVTQLERAIGVSIENIALNSNEKFEMEVNDRRYEDKIRSFLVRIARKFYSSDNQRLGRDHLLMVKQGLSHQEATENSMKHVRNPIPVEASQLNSNIVKAIERQIHCNIEDIGINNNEQFTIMIGDKEFLDCPLNLFTRLAKTFDGSRAEARFYLRLRRDGFEHEAALAQALGATATVDDEFDRISELNLEDSIALLQNDPVKLKRYLQFAHPELLEEDVDHLILRSFTGLKDDDVEKSEDKYLAWDSSIQNITLNEVPIGSDEPSVLLEGFAKDCTHIFISGVYTRRKRVENGRFAITVPLKIGQENEIRIMGLNIGTKQRSSQQSFVIEQTGTEDDIEALVDLLSDLREDTFKNIQKDPGRFQYLCHTLEQSLIKKFARSFHDGERYIQKLRDRGTTSPLMRRVMNTVLKKFQQIYATDLPGVIEGSLLFFQKYCAYEIRRRMEELKLPGVILANDPGTGKTRIVQAAIADRDATVITPNQVVTAWEEEAGKVLEDTDVLALHSIGHAVRKQRLKTRASAKKLLDDERGYHTYINREFIRNTEDKERFRLLSNDETIVVHDEAHSRQNEQSEQSKGARMLRSEFQILVTATPFKNPKTFRRMMAILKPKDPRFQSDKAFAKAFPHEDSQALKALSLLKDEVTIRFRKDDVMETVDPKQPLAQQRHKLPVKEFVPSEQMGEFEMSEEQAESIYQIFTNWDQWCRRNNKYIPKDEIAREDHLRTSNGFAKRHALRQTVNNPEYIGSSAPDAKLQEAQRIVAQCMKEGRKVVIFCAYEAQAIKYAEAFKKYNPALYTGQVSQSGKGNKYKKGDTGDNQHGWLLDKQGYPIPDSQGEEMSPLDYERIVFQNAAEKRLLIATYNAGSVGTTFTAGKAMIFDDLPADCIEAIQAEDRIHRIDPDRMTHADVKYYTMKSVYPEKFLSRMEKIWLVKVDGRYKEFSSRAAAEKYASRDENLEVLNAREQFFDQGTYDEFKISNLRAQRTMFRLINDGIADESVLQTHQDELRGLMNGNGKKS